VLPSIPKLPSSSLFYIHCPFNIFKPSNIKRNQYWIHYPKCHRPRQGDPVLASNDSRTSFTNYTFFRNTPQHRSSCIYRTSMTSRSASTPSTELLWNGSLQSVQNFLILLSGVLGSSCVIIFSP
jgi:hypothetical protein